MQKNRSRKLSAPVALLITLVVCVLAFFCAWLWKQSAGSGGVGGARKVGVTTVQSVDTLREGLVYYNGTTLGYVTPGGKIKWTYMAGTDVRFQATEYGVAMWRGKTLTLIDISDGTIYYSVTQADDVLSARVGPQYVAVVYGESQNSKVMLLDSGGGFVKTLSFDSQLILNYGFYSSGSYFWVLSLETDGTVASTTVSTYKPSSQLISGSITDGTQLTYDCRFFSDRIVCVGDYYQKTYDYTGTETQDKRQLVYGWYLEDYDRFSDTPLMAYVPNAAYGGSEKIQDVLLMTASGKQYLRFQFPCDAVRVYGGKAYGFSGDYGCIMVATPGQQTIQAYAVGVAFDEEYGVVGENKAVVSSGGELFLVNLP